MLKRRGKKHKNSVWIPLIAENWKHYSKIIFKRVNSAVWRNFREKVAKFHTYQSRKQYTRPKKTLLLKNAQNALPKQRQNKQSRNKSWWADPTCKGVGGNRYRKIDPLVIWLVLGPLSKCMLYDVENVQTWR